MFSRPKILFLVSLLFVALLNPKFNPYLLFKFLIFYHSCNMENHLEKENKMTFQQVVRMIIYHWIYSVFINCQFMWLNT